MDFPWLNSQLVSFLTLFRTVHLQTQSFLWPWSAYLLSLTSIYIFMSQTHLNIIGPQIELFSHFIIHALFQIHIMCAALLLKYFLTHSCHPNSSTIFPSLDCYFLLGLLQFPFLYPFFVVKTIFFFKKKNKNNLFLKKIQRKIMPPSCLKNFHDIPLLLRYLIKYLTCLTEFYKMDSKSSLRFSKHCIWFRPCCVSFWPQVLHTSGSLCLFLNKA